MSDQPTPPKPKPGSLRDRIAAFEKPVGSAAPAPAPVPRPKPGGISWKPKQPSPPSSPSTSDASFERKVGGMSASDAKESIKTGGSLKERMAALQNRGGFGAPPPVAPKPPVEKPKWKPPPVIAPVDKDDDDEPSRDDDGPKLSPPLRKSTSDERPTEDGDKAETGPPAEETEGESGEAAETDPEEEERQRRAAIAARMARLGGARVGMAPVFGRTSSAKKAELASEPVKSVTPAEEKAGEDKAQEEAAPTFQSDESTAISGPASNEQSSAMSDVVEPQNAPVRNDSAPSPSLTCETEPQSTPTNPKSMPIPTAPRRTAPPRRKTPKSPEAPPPAIVSEPIVTSPEIKPSPGEPTTDDDSAAAISDGAEKVCAGDVVEETGEINESVEKDETSTVVESLKDKPPVIAKEFVEEGVPEKPSSEANASEAKERVVEGVESDAVISSCSPELPSAHVNEDEPATSHTEALEDSQYVVSAATAHNKEELVADVEKHDDVDDLRIEEKPESKEEPVEKVTEEPDEDEEVARRKRIAEKLAKMGGVNPFALPPQRKTSASLEDIPTSPPLTKRSSTSQSSAGSSPLPSAPQSKQSSHEPIAESSDALYPTRTRSPESDAVEDYPPSPPPTRENTVASLGHTGINSEDDSREVTRDAGTATDITPASDIDSDTNTTPIREGYETADRKPMTSAPETDDYIAYKPFEDISDAEPAAAAAAPLPPIPNLATRPINTPTAVDPASPVNPIQDTVSSVPHVVHSRGSLPPPPPRLVPEPPESEEDLSESVFSNASSSRTPNSPLSYQPSEEDDDEPPRHLQMRRSTLAEEHDNDEAPPLPVLNRRSMQSDDFNPTSSFLKQPSARPSRLVPLPPAISAPASDVDDSDYDEALPTRPRHRPDTPSTPPAPSNEIPLIVPPPASDETVKRVEPSPLRHSSYPDSAVQPREGATPSSGEVSPALLSPPVPSPPARGTNQEVLDEEEGDPIDPSFHSPSRRTSMVVQPTLNPPAPELAAAAEEDDQAARRRTIAERMAKLGGIKFGAAPLPHSMRPTLPAPRDEGSERAASLDHSIDLATENTDLTEEEEERARKERIAAKLATMGGMRIGMMPLGVGSVRPQASQALTEEQHRPPPSRAIPPTRPPPPQTRDSDEHEDFLLMSQYSNATSDDGVKVEAEDSEIEEVSYTDAQETEEEPEEVLPPVPARVPRKRGTADSESDQPFSSTPPRPPVPTSSLPNRRTSTQSTTSTARRPSADSSQGVKKASAYKPHSEYVMVEEPSGFVPEEDIPPPPPARPSHRPPPRSAPPPPPPPPQPSIPISDSISSQWEMPSIPNASIEFATPADISLTWPEDSSTSSSSRSPPPPPPAADVPRSSDELMTVWGRVGVQICEVATTLYETSKKSLVGDGTYDGFIRAVLSEVPNATMPISTESYGYIVYSQTGNAVQKRASEILPGDILMLQDAKLKGHKGLQSYHQNVGIGQPLVGVVSEFEPKKSKTVEAVSYRLEDLKSGTVKVFRVLEN
ncbi:hypothetical protein H0H87_006212 [Tephrocybe sp. NHM501043]|nr:hypothetical protein H0H87_006212 [Tephrocybe sp. NHM501043]